MRAELLIPTRFTEVKSAKNATAHTAYGTCGAKFIAARLPHTMRDEGIEHIVHEHCPTRHVAQEGENSRVTYVKAEPALGYACAMRP